MIAVIGVGSPFGGDNIAQHVILRLQRHCAPAEFAHALHVEYYDRPHFYLLELLKPFREVHIVDAMMSEQPVGTLHRYEDIKLLQGNKKNLSSHGMAVAEVLALGEALNILPEKIIIHGIEIDESLSMCNEIEQACDELVSRLKEELVRNIFFR